MAIIFAIPIFLASFSLFLLEPLVGKLLLPSFGGTPAIWNTCLVFFQMALLAGYFISAILIRIRTTLVQVVLIVALMTMPLFLESFSAFSIGTIGKSSSPVMTLITWLCLTIGLPFVTISILPSAIQSWFSKVSGHKIAPYRLYAASNAGSLIGLLSYPFLFERFFGLKDQIEIWKNLYLALIASILLIGLFAAAKGVEIINDTDREHEGASPTLSQVFSWVGLAAIPSALLLGVTTFLLTDLVSLPLLWIVPLVIYLITYVIAFGIKTTQWNSRLVIPTSFTAILATICFFLDLSTPLWFLLTLHLLLFYLLAQLCHCKLAASAPTPKFLGRFYVALALGGVVGGLSIQLLAPLLFSRAIEYPLTIGLALVVLAGVRIVRQELGFLRIYIVPGVLILGVFAGGMLSPALSFVSGYGIAAILLYSLSRQRGAFALSFLVFVIAACWVPSPLGRTIDVRRSFYGITRTVISDEGRAHAVVHGSTIHGVQMTKDRERCVPTSYFHPTAPVGKLLSNLESKSGSTRRISVLGLGVGSLICYARGDDTWVFHEINPDMKDVAEDPRLFTFMTNAPTKNYRVELGDGRLTLADETENFDAIFLDAFTSDAIPVHLLTVEAVHGYLSKLNDGGLLVFQVSSRYFELEPFVTAAGAANGLLSWVANDLTLTPEQALEGKRASQWIVLSKDRTNEELLRHAGFTPAPESSTAAWTDDRSNPLDALM